ncbi:cell wall-recycling L,D-carboxypeptidase ElsL [Thiomicrorhabdus hydrogeniphila]
MSYFIVISISKQTLDVFDSAHSQPIKSYAISSGLNGVGCEKNSGKTPLGNHIVRAKIGQDEPLNTVFVGRRPTGEIYSKELAQSQPERDWILSRILWLSGSEVGVNRLGQVDTMQRYIYIHGTPDTEPMGIALSHGCIRMRNHDLMELFDLIDIATPVEIVC